MRRKHALPCLRSSSCFSSPVASLAKVVSATPVAYLDLKIWQRPRQKENPRTDSQKRERPPAEVESIPRTLDGRAGNVCVWKCVSKICKSHYMKKVELLIMPTPSGDPLLRGSCSACPDVKFAFVGNTEENRRLMQLAFERHVREVHMGESGNQSDSP